MRNNVGGLPWFSSRIELPEEVSSTIFLCKVCEEFNTGARIMVIDLLVQDRKLSDNVGKRPLYLIDDDKIDKKNILNF